MLNNTFNVSNLLHENFITERTVYDSFIEETYLFKTLRYVAEMKKEYREVAKEFYLSLTESGDDQVITESFSSFFEKVKVIINKFIQFIKTLVSKFIVALNSTVKSEKYINKHKEQLKNFSEKHQFNLDIYNFTNLDNSNIPKANALTSFQKEYDEIAKILDTISTTENNKRLDSINNIYNMFTDSLQSGWYDNFRGEVVGRDSVGATEFAGVLFSLFRDESSDTVNETIDYNRVFEALNRFENYHDLQKSIEKIKSELEKDYESIKRHISKMVYKTKENKIDLKTDSNNIQSYDYAVTPDIMSKLDLLIKSKIDQVSQMSSIHAMGLSAKLDAVTSCLKQDKIILYKALYRVQGLKEQGGK
jgi:DNA-binding ferritin-like protein (Dps family)